MTRRADNEGYTARIRVCARCKGRFEEADMAIIRKYKMIDGKPAYIGETRGKICDGCIEKSAIKKSLKKKAERTIHDRLSEGFAMLAHGGWDTEVNG